ncbi:hypothetical protein Tco_0019713 [Tanacetum coccineum]
MPILSVEDICCCISVSKVVSSRWSFVSAVLGQMIYPVASLALDSARLGVCIPPGKGIILLACSIPIGWAYDFLDTVAMRKYRFNPLKPANEINRSFRLLVFAMVAACASRAATTLLATSCRMAA